MIKQLRSTWLAGILAVLILCAGSDVWGFNIITHELLNGRAADVSVLDAYLKKHLGFARGLVEPVNGEILRRWVQIGGAAEDQFLGNELLGAALRSIHHFHNPLLTWDRAGLDALIVCPPFLLRGDASVRWAQAPNQGVAPNAAWGDARQSFHEGLTRSAKAGEAGRDLALARTFQILGQQMHLIADLAVPAHTRNDAHCPFPEGFEAWASRPDNRPLLLSLLAGQPVRPDPTIVTLGVPIPDDIATVPVARLWDTDQYDGTNPDLTLRPTIGLAEYTNANFLSDDTVFSSELPFPAPSSVELGPPEVAPKTGELRRYFHKVRDGEVIDHLGVPSALYEFLPDALKDKKIGLDDQVFQDYAAKLLPRAVGYSAALLDYFFRGSVEADAVTDFYAERLRLRLTNRTPNETMDGSFALYYETPDGTRKYLTAWTLTLAPDTPSDWLDLPPAPPDQAVVELGQYLLVFRGRLGAEEDAVVATRVGLGAYELILAYGTDSFGRVDDFGFISPLGMLSLTLPSPSEFTFYFAPATEEHYFRQAPSGATPYWESRGGFIRAIMRNPAVIPGTVAYLSTGGIAGARGGCDASTFQGSSGSQVTLAPVAIEIVEYEAPQDVATLQAYTWSSPPAVRSILGEFTVSPGQVITIPIPIEGARLFGVRLLNEVQAPPEPPDGGHSHNTCYLYPVLRIPR